MNIVQVLKELHRLGKIEEYDKIIELQEENQRFQDENMKLRSEVDALRAKLNDLQGLLETKDDLVYREEAYWRISNGEGPFCPTCWDSERKLLRMKGEGMYNCHKCDYTGTSQEEKAKQDQLMRDWRQI